MSDLIGIWCLESSENINAYFKQLGMSLAKRKNPLNLEPRMIISKNDDTWTIALDMKTKGTETLFCPGAYVDTSNELKFVFDARFYFDARRTSMSMFEFETPNKLIQNVFFTCTEETAKITREVQEGGKLLETLEMSGVIAKRIYKRNF